MTFDQDAHVMQTCLWMWGTLKGGGGGVCGGQHRAPREGACCFWKKNCKCYCHSTPSPLYQVKRSTEDNAHIYYLFREIKSYSILPSLVGTVGCVFFKKCVICTPCEDVCGYACICMCVWEGLFAVTYYVTMATAPGAACPDASLFYSSVTPQVHALRPLK